MAFRVLSIDGGGIRGILPGKILVALEEKLQKKSNNPNARLADYFDLVAGTSTGAILGAAYLCPGKDGKPKYSAQEVLDFYPDEGAHIFDESIWQKIWNAGGLAEEKYSSKGLKKALKKMFTDTKLSDLLKPTCFVSYDITARQQVIFTQHNAVKEQNDFLVRDLLRGSTAAPTYFEPAKIQSLNPSPKSYTLIDGGMVANDPALCAYSESIKFDGVNGIADMVIISIGTGGKLKKYYYNKVKKWGLVSWAKPAIDITLEGGPQMTAYHLNKIDSTVEGQRYFRISPELKNAKPDLDNATSKNIKDLLKDGDMNVKKEDQFLDKIADTLLEG